MKKKIFLILLLCLTTILIYSDEKSKQRRIANDVKSDVVTQLVDAVFMNSTREFTFLGLQPDGKTNFFDVIASSKEVVDVKYDVKPGDSMWIQHARSYEYFGDVKKFLNIHVHSAKDINAGTYSYWCWVNETTRTRKIHKIE